MDSSHSCSRRCVSTGRLQQNRDRLNVDFTQLLGHQEAMLFIAGHDRLANVGSSANAKCRLLQHRGLVNQRQKLFRVQLAR